MSMTAMIGHVESSHNEVKGADFHVQVDLNIKTHTHIHTCVWMKKAEEQAGRS